MIVKSTAKSRKLGGELPPHTSNIEIDEMCALCDRNIPDGKLVLRRKENARVICLICIVEIAEVK